MFLDSHPFAWLPLLAGVLSTARLIPEAVGGMGLVYVIVDHEAWKAVNRTEEVESIVDIVRTTPGSRVAAVFKESQPGHWSVSMRSPRSTSPNRHRVRGGSGHRAAGYPKPLDRIEKIVGDLIAALGRSLDRIEFERTARHRPIKSKRLANRGARASSPRVHPPPKPILPVVRHRRGRSAWAL